MRIASQLNDLSQRDLAIKRGVSLLVTISIWKI